MDNLYLPFDSTAVNPAVSISTQPNAQFQYTKDHVCYKHSKPAAPLLNRIKSTVAFTFMGFNAYPVVGPADGDKKYEIFYCETDGTWESTVSWVNRNSHLDFVASNAVAIVVNGTTYNLNTGDVIHVFPGSKFSFGVNAHFWLYSTDLGLGGLFAELSNGLARLAPAKPSLATIKSIALKHGVEWENTAVVTPFVPTGSVAFTASYKNSWKLKKNSILFLYDSVSNRTIEVRKGTEPTTLPTAASTANISAFYFYDPAREDKPLTPYRGLAATVNGAASLVLNTGSNYNIYFDVPNSNLVIRPVV